jgi:hypothetical protein
MLEMQYPSCLSIRCTAAQLLVGRAFAPSFFDRCSRMRQLWRPAAHCCGNSSSRSDPENSGSPRHTVPGATDCSRVTIVLPFVIPAVYYYLAIRPGSISNRVPLMEKGLKMTLANPVLGVGLNNSTAVKKQQFKDDVQGEYKFPIHNHYIVLAAELGIPGLLFFLGFLGLAIRQAVRNSRLEDPAARVLALGILGAFIGLFLHLLGDHFSSLVANSMLWLYTGLTMSLGRIVPDTYSQRAVKGIDGPAACGAR